MSDDVYKRIAANPRFQELVSKRSAFAWTLSAIVLFAYFGFILTVAFDKAFLATPLGTGVTTIGIPFGVGVIVLAFVLTGVYVRRANSEFDELTKQILSEARK